MFPFTVPRSEPAPKVPLGRSFFGDTCRRLPRLRFFDGSHGIAFRFSLTEGADMDYSDDHLRKILKRTKTIAVVGVSMNSVRPSYYVARYLSLKGYKVIPVNPGHAGKPLFGETIRADLSEISEPVDMVDIFRRSEAVPPIVDAALARFDRLQTIWMQIGVENADAAAMAEARGVDVIQNRCPKIEYQRLFGELRMGGFNTGVISSKLS